MQAHDLIQVIEENKMDAKEVAQKRASQRTRIPESRKTEKPGGKKTSAGHLPAGMTSYEDLMGSYKTGVVNTPSGLTFIIQTINPGDYIATVGTPLLKYWADNEVDINDPVARAKSVHDMPEDMKGDMVLDADFQEMVKNVVCAGIVPHDELRIVNKPPWECDKDKFEVPVSVIPIADVFHIFTEIMTLSQGEEFAEELDLFRNEPEIRPGEAVGDTDTPDGESIRAEAEPDIVPTNSEP